MTEALSELQEQAEKELAEAGTEEALQALRIKYLGRKGLLTRLLREISNVPSEERPEFGKRCNEIKDFLSAAIDEALQEKARSEKEKLLLKESFDVTLPGRGVKPGRLHPITQVLNDICAFFSGFGF